MRTKFADWLDQMQHEADKKSIVVQARHVDMLDYMFKCGDTPTEAVKGYELFLKRWNALTNNGKNTEPA